MNYTPTIWENGKKPAINATHLNKMENELARLANIVSVLDITETTETTMPNSNAGRLKIDSIEGGESQQGENPSPTNPQEIKKTVVSEIRTHGKQFYDVNTYPLMNGYVDATNGRHSSNESYLCTQYIPCEAWHGMTLTLNKRPGGSRPGIAFYLDESVTSFISGVTNSSATAGNPITFTIPIGVKYLRFTVPAEATEIMLNEGSESLPYEPYTESAITLSQPIDLYGKGDVQDVIIPKQIKRKFGKVILNGSEENISKDSLSGVNVYRFSMSLGAVAYSINQLCSHLQRASEYNQVTSKENSFAVSSESVLLNLKDITSVADLRTFLNSSPMTVIYELAEEVIEDLPLADQIALNSLKTFDGITYLEFDSEIEPTFKGEYGTSKVGGYTLEALLTARSK